MGGEVNGAVKEGLVFDDTARFDPAGARDDRLGGRIIDPHGEFVGCKPAEDDGVYGTDACAGEHSSQRFWHHRHIDDDAVASLNAFFQKGAS